MLILPIVLIALIVVSAYRSMEPSEEKGFWKKIKKPFVHLKLKWYDAVILAVFILEVIILYAIFVFWGDGEINNRIRDMLSHVVLVSVFLALYFIFRRSRVLIKRGREKNDGEPSKNDKKREKIINTFSTFFLWSLFPLLLIYAMGEPAMMDYVNQEENANNSKEEEDGSQEDTTKQTDNVSKFDSVSVDSASTKKVGGREENAARPTLRYHFVVDNSGSIDTFKYNDFIAEFFDDSVISNTKQNIFKIYHFKEGLIEKRIKDNSKARDYLTDSIVFSKSGSTLMRRVLEEFNKIGFGSDEFIDIIFIVTDLEDETGGDSLFRNLQSQFAKLYAQPMYSLSGKVEIDIKKLVIPVIIHLSNDGGSKLKKEKYETLVNSLENSSYVVYHKWHYSTANESCINDISELANDSFEIELNLYNRQKGRIIGRSLQPAFRYSSNIPIAIDIPIELTNSNGDVLVEDILSIKPNKKAKGQEQITHTSAFFDSTYSSDIRLIIKDDMGVTVRNGGSESGVISIPLLPSINSSFIEYSLNLPPYTPFIVPNEKLYLSVIFFSRTGEFNSDTISYNVSSENPIVPFEQGRYNLISLDTSSTEATPGTQVKVATDKVVQLRVLSIPPLPSAGQKEEIIDFDIRFFLDSKSHFIGDLSLLRKHKSSDIFDASDPYASHINAKYPSQFQLMCYRLSMMSLTKWVHRNNIGILFLLLFFFTVISAGLSRISRTRFMRFDINSYRELSENRLMLIGVVLLWVSILAIVLPAAVSYDLVLSGLWGDFYRLNKISLLVCSVFCFVQLFAILLAKISPTEAPYERRLNRMTNLVEIVSYTTALIELSNAV